MNRNALIGWTGFVGGNLAAPDHYQDLYNSSNIDQIAGKRYDLVVCAGVKSAMWLANNDPAKDLEEITTLISKLEQCEIGKLVWISTVAVYPDDGGAYSEETDIFESKLAYGLNRRKAELMIADRFSGHCIIRLPALFGKGLKKNLIYDLTNRVPGFLKAEVIELVEALGDADALETIKVRYRYDESTSMYKYNVGADTDVAETEAILKRTGVSVLDFTHAESCFQYYNLANLQRDIDRALELGLTELNISSEPLSAKEIVAALTGEAFENTSARKYLWDVRSAHASHWGHDSGYLYEKGEVLADLQDYYAKHLRT